MIVGFGDATDDFLNGDRSDDGSSSSDTGATAVGIANSSGLTALISGITSIFGGHSTTKTGGGAGGLPPPASSGTSPLVWVAGAGALLLVGLVVMNRRAS
jgi:hypothetical protein